MSGIANQKDSLQSFGGEKVPFQYSIKQAAPLPFGSGVLLFMELWF